MSKRWFVGHTGTALVAFSFAGTPTTISHGKVYKAVIGPFKTKAGALWAEKYGLNNPHFRVAADADRFAFDEKVKESITKLLG